MNPVATFKAQVDVKDIEKIKFPKGDQHYGNAARIIGEILAEGGTVELRQTGKEAKSFSTQAEFEAWSTP